MSRASRLVLQATRGAVFQVAAPERFLALVSASSRPVYGVTADHLRVLACFRHAATTADVVDDLMDEMHEDDVEMLAEDLLSWDLLRVADAPRGQTGGFGHIESHLPMVADGARVRAYAEAIQRHAAGKRVAEIGCGTGILSLVAAKSGAQSVWTVEETDIADVANAVFRANKVQNRVSVVRASSFDVEPPELVDLLIHELFGVDPFEEGVMSAITDARRRWLAPGGRLLPVGFRVMACAVGGASWRHGVARVARIRDLAAELGITLEPVVTAGNDGPSRRLDAQPPPPRPEDVVGEPVCIVEVDLSVDADLDSRRDVGIVCPQGGEVGALLLWFDILMDETQVFPTSPFAPETHWGWQVWDLPETIQVRPGEKLYLTVVIETVDGCPQMDVVKVRRART